MTFRAHTKLLLAITICAACVAMTCATSGSNDTYAAVSPEIKTYMETNLLPPGYVLANNVYDWNATEIYILINASHPTLFPGLDKSALLIFFPAPFLTQLPRDLLISKGMCDYLPPTDPVYCGNSTIPFTSACFNPFTETKFTPLFENCGLRCEFSPVLWGIKASEQEVLDQWRIICTIFFLCAAVIVLINHYFELSKTHFCDTTILFQAPTCVAMLYLNVSVMFIIPAIVNEDVFVCREDLNGMKTVSLGNPGAGDTRCFVVGFSLAMTMDMIGMYFALFSFGLWQQFYLPLRKSGEWPIVGNESTIGKCLTSMYNNKKEMDHSMEAWVQDLTRAHSTIGGCCRVYCCGDTLKYHLFIWITSFFLVLPYATTDAIDGFRPIGTCIFGGNDPDFILWLIVIPYGLMLFFSALFLPMGIYLLQHLKMSSASTREKRVLRKLGWRLMVYFVCTLICWTLVVVFVSVFYDKRDDIFRQAESSFGCVVLNTSDPSVCIHGTTVPLEIYMLMFVSVAFAGIGSCVLSCRHKVIRQWKENCLPLSLQDNAMIVKLTAYGDDMTSTTRVGTETSVTTAKTMSRTNSTQMIETATSIELQTADTLTLPNVTAMDRVLSVSQSGDDGGAESAEDYVE